MRADIIGVAITAISVLGLGHCGTSTPQPSPSPSPTVAPSPAPSPTPTPVPTPTPGECYAPADGPQWHPADPQQPTQLLTLVRGAQQQIGDVCGQPPETSLEVLAGTLREAGLCAGRQGDAVMVQRADGLFEEMHAVYYGDGCWLSNAYRGLWEYR